MAGINLLPQQTKPKVSIVKLSRRIRRFLISGFVILIFLASTVIGVIFILSNNLKGVLSNQADIKNQIKSLEVTEQKLFLIKDRLGKIKDVQTAASAKEELDSLATTLTDVSQQSGSSFSGAVLSTTQAKVTLTVDNSTTLSHLLYALYANDSFKQIDLLSLSYDSSKGYVAQLGIAK